MEDRIYDIAGKYFSGNKLSPDEEKLFSAWTNNKNNKSTFNELKQAWEISLKAKKQITPDIDAEWQRFLSMKDKQPKTRAIRPAFYIPVAASILLIVGLFSFHYFTHRQNDIQISSTAQKKEIVLPDNSRIWLNKNTTITYNKNFGKTNRNIKLEGEAYFEVRKSNIAFNIFSPGNIKTEVLGTKFNLKAYKNDSSTELFVAEGRVAFGKENSGHRQIFERNQQASCSKKTGLIQPGQNSNALSWQTGILVFNNTPVNKVKTDLEHYFGIKITLPQSSDNLRFSGKYTNPKSGDIAEILDVTFNWKHKLTNETLIFSTAN